MALPGWSGLVDAAAQPRNDHGSLRRSLSAFATGVTVVTVGGSQPHGMTANSFTSVSLEPPLVLVCVERAGVMCENLARQRRFAVSVLSSAQAAVAIHFASRARPAGDGQFAGVAWFTGPQTGAPLIADAAAHFECELWRAYDGGDHVIVVGKLVAASHQNDVSALLFHHGAFSGLNPAHRARSAA